MTAYYWKDGRVVERKHCAPIDAAEREGLLNCPCVDDYYRLREEDYRYGKTSKPEGWSHTPKHEFPGAFLLELMLLGIQ